MLGSTSATARRRCLLCPISSSSSSSSSSGRRLLSTARAFGPKDVRFRQAAAVSGRSVLRVSGSDAHRFLNGLAAVRLPDLVLDQDSSSGPPRPVYGAFLHAQGRILHDTFIYSDPVSRSFLIDHPSPSTLPPLAPPLLAHLKRFVLRSKVGVKDVSADWAVWAAWGPSADDAGEPEAEWGGERVWKWGNGATAELGWSREPAGWTNAEGELGGWDVRAPGMGWRGLVKSGSTPSVLPPTGSASILPSAAYTAHRLAHGVPEGPDELIPLAALPSESNLDFMGGVDFRKGCYVGQELTVRTYHTGQTRKRIVPVDLVEEVDDGSSERLKGAAVQLVFTPAAAAAAAAGPSSSSSSSSASPSPSTSPAGPARRPARPKAAGKLLTFDRLSGQGLALLRLEHVAAWSRGEGWLQVTTTTAAPTASAVEEGGAGAGEGGEAAPSSTPTAPAATAAVPADAAGVVNAGQQQQPTSTSMTWAVRPRLDKVAWWPSRPSPPPPSPSPTSSTLPTTTTAAAAEGPD